MATEPSFFGKGDVSSPVANAVSITPHDVTVLIAPVRALWVGTAGDIVLVFKNDSASVTIKNVPAGALLPFQVRQVKATGTTAADIIGLY